MVTLDPSAADLCHRRQPESSGAAASRKTDDVLPNSHEWISQNDAS